MTTPKKSRKRRGRAEGSIYKRGDGTWTASVSLGYDDHGKRKRKVLYGRTKNEVQQKLQQLQQKVSAGANLDADSVTLRDWLHRWLQAIKPTVEPGTYRPYEQHVRLHLIPHIGNTKLTAMKSAHVWGLYSALTENGVSAALQRKVGTTLTIALNQAVKGGLIQGNPAASVTKPKATKPDIRILAPDEAGRFLKEAKEDRLYPYYLTALDSGARPGELLALTWGDVDFTSGEILITKTLEEINGQHRIKETKTRKSRRRVPLSQGTLDELARHRKEMLSSGNVGGPVFCDTAGGHLRISNIYRDSFDRLLHTSGVPPMRLYDLRHTCATLLLLADVPAKVVSERLGHSTITLTLDTYSHVLPTMQKQAADTIGRLLDGTGKQEKRSG